MEWIELSKQKPKNRQPILVTDGQTVLAGAYCQGPDEFCINTGPFALRSCSIGIGELTHWMPLPEPPKKNKPQKTINNA
jgi:hypothetical protein